MVTEDYVSFETAKLLKEKGFMDGEMVKFFASGYDKYGNILPIQATELNDYPRPTLQMAMKWLREIHNIAIDTEWEHLWYAYVKPMTSKPCEDDYHQCESLKYEQACEAAIKYCLENLI